MRLDQVQTMLENAGLIAGDESEIYLTDSNAPRLLVHGPEQTFYIVPSRRDTSNAGGFQVYHPWAVPSFPRAQVQAKVSDPDELLAYLTLHFGEEPVVFLEREAHEIDMVAQDQVGDEPREFDDYDPAQVDG